MNLLKRKNGDLTWFCWKNLDIPDLKYGFFTRAGGNSRPPYESLNAAWRTEDPHTDENRRKIFRLMNWNDIPKFLLSPDHRDNILDIDDIYDERSVNLRVITETDALIASESPVVMLVSTADCIPVFIFEPQSRLCGLVHAGWRGVANNITIKTLERMQKKAKMRPRDFLVGIGPCIGPECYTMSHPVQKEDPKWMPWIKKISASHYSVDIKGKLLNDLHEFGILENHIFDAGICTACRNELFFSASKEGRKSGRFLSFIARQVSPTFDEGSEFQTPEKSG